MKLKSALFAVVLLGASVSAFAQSSNTQSGSTAGATAEGGQLIFSPTTNSDVKYPASTAIAPALAVTAPCMGSSTGGVEGLKFGFSLGTTWSDEECKLIRDSSQLWQMGMQKAAVAMLCTSDKFAYAISVSGGIPIPGTEKGTFVMIGCPMSQKAWEAAGRPTLDPVTGQPAKLGVVVNPPVLMPAPAPIAATASPAQETELKAIAIEAKDKYGIDLAIREGTAQKVAATK
jgi:hypothetical protein